MKQPSSRSEALVPLSQVIADGGEDLALVPGFVADLHGEKVEITAVLTRTAVVASTRDCTADKELVLLTDLRVDPAVIDWRPKAAPMGFSVRRRRRTP